MVTISILDAATNGPQPEACPNLITVDIIKKKGPF
jgi:hypothetical protein